jgi:hypothetical protein
MALWRSIEQGGNHIEGGVRCESAADEQAGHGHSGSSDAAHAVQVHAVPGFEAILEMIERCDHHRGIGRDAAVGDAKAGMANPVGSPDCGEAVAVTGEFAGLGEVDEGGDTRDMQFLKFSVFRSPLPGAGVLTRQDLHPRNPVSVPERDGPRVRSGEQVLDHGRPSTPGVSTRPGSASVRSPSSTRKTPSVITKRMPAGN